MADYTLAFNSQHAQAMAKFFNEQVMSEDFRRFTKGRAELEKPHGQRILWSELNRRCIYTPHSLRATTATVLLHVGVDIRRV